MYEAANALLKMFNKEFEEQYNLYKAKMATAAARRESAPSSSSTGANNIARGNNGGGARSTGLTTKQRQKCTEILNALETTAQSEAWGWPLFFAPADRTVYKNYKIFVPRPLNLGTCTTRLKQRKGGFRSTAEFAKDVKRALINWYEYLYGFTYECMICVSVCGRGSAPTNNKQVILRKLLYRSNLIVMNASLSFKPSNHISFKTFFFIVQSALQP